MRNPGILLILAAACLWGTTGTTQALAPAGASPVALGIIRLAGGGLTLQALAGLRRVPFNTGRWPLRPLILAVLTIVLYQLMFFAGVGLAGVAVGTLVGIGSVPIFAGLLDAVFDGGRLSRRWYLSTVLAVVGCAMLALSGDDVAAVNPVGLLLATGAGLSYALFTLANKRLLAHHPADAVMAVVFCSGTILLLPALLLVETAWLVSAGGVAVMLHLGLIATGFAYALFGRGLRTVSVAVTGTLTLAEPLTAAVLGVLLLGERLSPGALLGIGLLFAGLSLLTLRPARLDTVSDNKA